MPSRVTDSTSDVETKPDPSEPIEGPAEGFDEGFAWKKVKYRGTTYKLVELPIGEWTKAETSATVTKAQPDGTEIELIDQNILNRIALAKSLVEPKTGEPGYRPVGEMPTRLFFNLRQAMRDLHTAIEEDELRPAKKPETNGQSGNA